MRTAISIVLLMLLTACMSTADGPFQQLKGRAIDYDAVDRLVENQSTKPQVLEALGDPTEMSTAGGNEIIKYVSVKQRESISKLAGIRVGRSKQTMEETVTLTISNGVLARKEKASVVH
jgi:outer membrane protein assembly factor BamE (lipoprotein component of BamABCDE complex)